MKDQDSCPPQVFETRKRAFSSFEIANGFENDSFSF